jgi:hypothetical protein
MLISRSSPAPPDWRLLTGILALETRNARGCGAARAPGPALEKGPGLELTRMAGRRHAEGARWRGQFGVARGVRVVVRALGRLRSGVLTASPGAASRCYSTRREKTLGRPNSKWQREVDRGSWMCCIPRTRDPAPLAAAPSCQPATRPCLALLCASLQRPPSPLHNKQVASIYSARPSLQPAPRSSRPRSVASSPHPCARSRAGAATSRRARDARPHRAPPPP